MKRIMKQKKIERMKKVFFIIGVTVSIILIAVLLYLNIDVILRSKVDAVYLSRGVDYTTAIGNTKGGDSFSGTSTNTGGILESGSVIGNSSGVFTGSAQCPFPDNSVSFHSGGMDVKMRGVSLSGLGMSPGGYYENRFGNENYKRKRSEFTDNSFWGTFLPGSKSGMETGHSGDLTLNTLYSKNTSMSKPFSALSNTNDEDPIEGGGGTENEGGYNDAPLDDANLFLLVLAVMYVAIMKKNNRLNIIQRLRIHSQKLRMCLFKKK